jgi:hypothetical protein
MNARELPPAATPTGSKRARRLAIRLLRWYPRPWRARYAPEMRALLDEMPVAWRQAADLAIGAAREWLSPRAVGWPARSAAGRVQVARGLKFIAVAALVELAVHASVPRDAAVAGAMPYLESAATAVLYGFCLRIVFGWLHWMERPCWLARLGWFGPPRSPEIALWFGGILLLLVHQHATPVPAYVREPGFHVFMQHVQLLVWLQNLFFFSRRSFRLRRVESSHLKRMLTVNRTW